MYICLQIYFLYYSDDQLKYHKQNIAEPTGLNERRVNFLVPVQFDEETLVEAVKETNPYQRIVTEDEYEKNLQSDLALCDNEDWKRTV